MKAYSFIFVIICLIGIFSCNNDDDNTIQQNFISSIINQQNWDGTPEISFSSIDDTLRLLGHGNEQVINFKMKFNGVGNYILKGNQATYYTTIGGDVITSFYKLESNSTASLNITRYDANQNILEGNFELLLKKEWSNPENNIDSLIFENGKFKGQISN